MKSYIDSSFNIDKYIYILNYRIVALENEEREKKRLLEELKEKKRYYQKDIRMQ